MCECVHQNYFSPLTPNATAPGQADSTGPDCIHEGYEAIFRSVKSPREQVAEFLNAYGPLLLRRIRGKLRAARDRNGTSYPSAFDSDDILASVIRRIDLLACRGTLRIDHPGELIALLHVVTDRAVCEAIRKSLAARRAGEVLRSMPRPCAAAQPLDAPDIAARVGSLQRRLTSGANEVLLLRVRGLTFRQIAAATGRTPQAVRRQWCDLLLRLRR